MKVARTLKMIERSPEGEVAFDAVERVQRLLGSVQDYAIFALDIHGVIQTWNPGAERLKGYTAKEAIGRHFSTFYPPEDRTAGKCQRLLELATRQGHVEDEGWRVRKDGSFFWASVVISAIRDDDGRLVGYSKVTRDLTERRQAQEVLRQSEQRFRLLLESVQDYAIYMVDLDGRVVTWNAGAARVKGYTARDIIGRHVSVFYTAEDREAGACERELKVAAEDGRLELEGWRVRQDGTQLWASVVITAMRDAHGVLVGFAKVTRDLTERRRAEQERLRLAQTQEALRLRDEFVSIAAHELRTPLTALQLGLQGLSRQANGWTDAVTKRLSRSIRSAERLAQLVESLLDVTRISHGRLQLHRSRFDLTEVAREVVDRLHDAAVHASCTLTVELDGSIVGEWDRLRTEQILINLLGNAFKYAANAPVRLAVKRAAESAVIEVEDQGPGIPEADLDRIFGRFERATSHPPQGGLGLGLYVTQELVRAHGGTVHVQNRATGGLSFTVHLPLEPRDATPSSAGDRSDPEPAPDPR
jgi:PAS domain S-box-containing protein